VLLHWIVGSLRVMQAHLNQVGARRNSAGESFAAVRIHHCRGLALITLTRYGAFKLNPLIYVFVRHLLALDVFHGMVGNLARLGQNLHHAALRCCQELRGLVAGECTFWSIALSCASGSIGQSCEPGTVGWYVSSGNGAPTWCA
jgi:hypothetical protein